MEKGVGIGVSIEEGAGIGVSVRIDNTVSDICKDGLRCEEIGVVDSLLV